MKSGVRIASLPAVALALGQCGPAQPIYPKEGLWAGQIDGREARLCLTVNRTDGSGSTFVDGRYYLVGEDDIRELYFDARTGRFAELGYPFSDGHTLVLQQSRPGQLTVIRQSGGKTRSAELAAVPVAEKGKGSCASAAFLQPRLEQLVRTEEIRTIGDQAYKRFQYDPGLGYDDVKMIGIALDGSQPADAAINARLQMMVTSWGPGDDFRSCRLRNFNEKRGFSFEAEARFLSVRFLSFSVVFDGLCGGSPDYGTYFVTLDRKSGDQVGLADWFRPEAGTADRQGYADYLTPSAELRRVMLGSIAVANPQNTGLAYDLSEAANESGPLGSFELFLNQKGIGFTRYDMGDHRFPRGTLIVPWARIKPFLNRQAQSELGLAD